MPTYDFRCLACDERFEIVRGIKDDSPVTCPSCGGGTKRVFTPVGVVFKGSGFHNTDYRPKTDAPSTGDCPAASGGDCASCPASED